MQEYERLLCEAARLVDAASSHIKTTKFVCSQCGVTHYSDKAKWKKAQELRAISQKLLKLSEDKPACVKPSGT